MLSKTLKTLARFPPSWHKQVCAILSEVTKPWMLWIIAFDLFDYCRGFLVTFIFSEWGEIPQYLTWRKSWFPNSRISECLGEDSPKSQPEDFGESWHHSILSSTHCNHKNIKIHLTDLKFVCFLGGQSLPLPCATFRFAVTPWGNQVPPTAIPAPARRSPSPRHATWYTTTPPRRPTPPLPRWAWHDGPRWRWKTPPPRGGSRSKHDIMMLFIWVSAVW